MNNQPLLSICIPTYNRSTYLKKTLDSIVSQADFNTDDVEIVISDNCSTDDTPEIIKDFTIRYENIHYFRNDKNINDRNFPLVLTKAKGVFRKLINDTLCFNEGSLRKLLEIVRDNLTEKPILFFNNLGSKSECFSDLDSFLYKVSYQITWIGGLGVWADFLSSKENLFEGCDTKLWQTIFLLDYLVAKKKSYVINKKLFYVQSVLGKNLTYGLHEVFYTRYLGLIDDYVKKGLVSKNCYNWLEKDLLFRFFTINLYNWEFQNKKFCFDKCENLKLLLSQSYGQKRYFFIYRFFYFLYKCLKQSHLDACVYKLYCLIRK